VDVGSSYLPSDILAAFLYAQFEHAQEIQAARQLIWGTYHTALASWARANQVRQPVIPPHCEQTYHMYYLLLPSLDIRQRLIEHLKKYGILSVFHYLPLHLSQMGTQFGGKAGDCPVTEDISDRLLRLPFFYQLNASEQAYIISTIESFAC
jgi:dTDP-4-amino-4,6-dideoxygalactose transaminase